MPLAYKYEEYYTIDDFLKWEGDWELIRGFPYAMSPFALPHHQLVSGNIFFQLKEKLQDCIFCSVFMETEVVFSKDTIVRPDCIVYCHEFDKILDKTPDIIFEVVSKGSIKRDEIIKKILYEEEGVKYYCIVYYDKKSVRIYKNNGEKFIKIADIENEKFLFEEIKCKIEFNFSKIWEK